MNATQLEPTAAAAAAAPLAPSAPERQALDRWPKANVALHWSSAVLVLALLGVGFTMVGLAPDDRLRRHQRL